MEEIKDDPNFKLVKQGAEGRVFETTFLGRDCIVKERFPKKYRHPELEASLTRKRLLAECRALQRCQRLGISCPTPYFVDIDKGRIFMEKIEGTLVKDIFNEKGKTASDFRGIAEEIGKVIAKLHDNGMVHGDLTTSNMMILTEKNEMVFIDFGLSMARITAEEKGVDLYVLERAILSSHPTLDGLFELILESYYKHSENTAEVRGRFEAVRKRGRKRLAFG